MELNKRRIDFAAEVEADCFMFMGAGKPKDRPVEPSDLAALADVSEDWAEYAAQYGLEVCYHIHTNTTVDSIDDWAKYMSLLRKCKLCIDVSHAALWGSDPVESISRYRDALVYVHLQDYSAVTGGDDTPYDVDWVDVGSGTVMDFRKSWRRWTKSATTDGLRLARAGGTPVGRGTHVCQSGVFAAIRVLSLHVTKKRGGQAPALR